MSVGKSWVRLAVEHLEDRCTPSALGRPSAHAPAPPGEPPALAAALAAGTPQHAVHIRLSAHITSDGSGVLSLTGVGSQLGRWTGQGTIDDVGIDAEDAGKARFGAGRVGVALGREILHQAAGLEHAGECDHARLTHRHRTSLRRAHRCAG